LITEEPLDWDTLRKVVILATRFAARRPLKNRTLKQLSEDVQKFISEQNEVETEQEREIHNLRVMYAASQDYIERQNIQYNELRIAYVEATRTLQEYKEGARSGKSDSLS
jgi:hypothetical protein